MKPAQPGWLNMEKKRKCCNKHRASIILRLHGIHIYEYMQLDKRSYHIKGKILSSAFFQEIVVRSIVHVTFSCSYTSARKNAIENICDIHRFVFLIIMKFENIVTLALRCRDSWRWQAAAWLLCLVLDSNVETFENGKLPTFHRQINYRTYSLRG